MSIYTKKALIPPDYCPLTGLKKNMDVCNEQTVAPITYVTIENVTEWLPHCSVVAVCRSGMVMQWLNEKQVYNLF